ncbi:hypothetical protein CCUS01_01603 [Colletotrichum cuscutae]|uniref:Uncharacterized protein n=1 Tax=Colletotrichum cuscutae TaxID=1209917 RepID=A0AAI9XRN5_9PEZI|nr:hypothetical protein CCUS01_01603 [Colletotrichum cuscutae]
MVVLVFATILSNDSCYNNRNVRPVTLIVGLFNGDSAVSVKDRLLIQARRCLLLKGIISRAGDKPGPGARVRVKMIEGRSITEGMDGRRAVDYVQSVSLFVLSGKSTERNESGRRRGRRMVGERMDRRLPSHAVSLGLFPCYVQGPATTRCADEAVCVGVGFLTLCIRICRVETFEYGYLWLWDKVTTDKLGKSGLRCYRMFRVTNVIPSGGMHIHAEETGNAVQRGGALPVSTSRQANSSPFYALGQGNARYMLRTVGPTDNFHAVRSLQGTLPFVMAHVARLGRGEYDGRASRGYKRATMQTVAKYGYLALAEARGQKSVGKQNCVRQRKGNRGARFDNKLELQTLYSRGQRGAFGCTPWLCRPVIGARVLPLGNIPSTLLQLYRTIVHTTLEYFVRTAYCRKSLGTRRAPANGGSDLARPLIGGVGPAGSPHDLVHWTRAADGLTLILLDAERPTLWRWDAVVSARIHRMGLRGSGFWNLIKKARRSRQNLEYPSAAVFGRHSGLDGYFRNGRRSLSSGIAHKVPTLQIDLGSQSGTRCLFLIIYVRLQAQFCLAIKEHLYRIIPLPPRFTSKFPRDDGCPQDSLLRRGPQRKSNNQDKIKQDKAGPQQTCPEWILQMHITLWPVYLQSLCTICTWAALMGSTTTPLPQRKLQLSSRRENRVTPSLDKLNLEPTIQSNGPTHSYNLSSLCDVTALRVKSLVSFASIPRSDPPTDVSPSSDWRQHVTIAKWHGRNPALNHSLTVLTVDHFLGPLIPSWCDDGGDGKRKPSLAIQFDPTTLPVTCPSTPSDIYRMARHKHQDDNGFQSFNGLRYFVRLNTKAQNLSKAMKPYWVSSAAKSTWEPLFPNHPIPSYKPTLVNKHVRQARPEETSAASPGPQGPLAIFAVSGNSQAWSVDHSEPRCFSQIFRYPRPHHHPITRYIQDTPSIRLQNPGLGLRIRRWQRWTACYQSFMRLRWESRFGSLARIRIMDSLRVYGVYIFPLFSGEGGVIISLCVDSIYDNVPSSSIVGIHRIKLDRYLASNGYMISTCCEPHPHIQESLSVADVSWIIQELTRLMNLEFKQVIPLVLLAAPGFRIARTASSYRVSPQQAILLAGLYNKLLAFHLNFAKAADQAYSIRSSSVGFTVRLLNRKTREPCFAKVNKLTVICKVKTQRALNVRWGFAISQSLLLPCKSCRMMLFQPCLSGDRISRTRRRTFPVFLAFSHTYSGLCPFFLYYPAFYTELITSLTRRLGCLLDDIICHLFLWERSKTRQYGSGHRARRQVHVFSFYKTLSPPILDACIRVCRLPPADLLSKDTICLDPNRWDRKMNYLLVYSKPHKHTNNEMPVQLNDGKLKSSRRGWRRDVPMNRFPLLTGNNCLPPLSPDEHVLLNIRRVVMMMTLCIASASSTYFRGAQISPRTRNLVFPPPNTNDSTNPTVIQLMRANVPRPLTPFSLRKLNKNDPTTSRTGDAIFHAMLIVGLPAAPLAKLLLLTATALALGPRGPCLYGSSPGCGYNKMHLLLTSQFRRRDLSLFQTMFWGFNHGYISMTIRPGGSPRPVLYRFPWFLNTQVIMYHVAREGSTGGREGPSSFGSRDEKLSHRIPPTDHLNSRRCQMYAMAGLSALGRPEQMLPACLLNLQASTLYVDALSKLVGTAYQSDTRRSISPRNVRRKGLRR